jgi:hypothetical protein
MENNAASSKKPLNTNKTMKLKDFLYLGIIAFLVIKVLVGSPEKTKYLPANKDSLNAYKSQIAELQKLLLVSNNERDSIQKLRNKIKIKYEKEYEIYLVKDSIANSLSVDSIQKYWAERYHNRKEQ